MRKDKLMFKYEPKKLGDVIGNLLYIDLLKINAKQRDIPSPLIISGISGIGKTCTAKIITATNICENPHLNDEGYYDPCWECPSCKTVSPLMRPQGFGSTFASVTKVKGQFKLTGLDNSVLDYENYKVVIIENSNFLLDARHPAYFDFLGLLDSTDIKLILNVSSLPKIGTEYYVDPQIFSRSTFLSFAPPSESELVSRLIYITDSEIADPQVRLQVPEGLKEEFYTIVLPELVRVSQFNVRLSVNYLETCFKLNLWSYKQANAYFRFSVNVA